MNQLKYPLALTLALLTLLAGKPRSFSHFLNGVASAHTISSPSQIASTDATLEWLAVENAPMAFDSDTPSYSVNVPHTVDKTIVRAGATDSDASYIVRLGNNVQGVSLLPTATPTDDPPMNFRVSGVDDDSVSLQWERAPRNRGIVSGKIRVYEHMGSAYQFVASYDAGILAGQLRVSYLRPDTLYKFTLIFSNHAGDAVRSQSVTARTQATPTTATPTPTPLTTPTTATPTPTPLTTQPTATPTPTPTDAPANFRVSDVGRDWVSLQWGAAPSNLGITSAEIAKYEHNGSGYHYVDRRSVGISGRSIVLYHLKSDTLYKFSLRFLDVDNDVVRSQTVTARTQAPQTTQTPTATPQASQTTQTPPPTPTDDPPMNFRVSGVGRDSISLQWERAPRNRGIVSGKIEAHEHMGSAYQFVVSYDAGILAGELRASHLKPDTLYKFILLFSNFAGDVVRRQTVTTRTQATQTTATPTPTATAASALPVPRLTAQAGADAVELRWTEVSGAVRYELMVWWDAGTGWQPIGGANLTGTSYTHTGVTAGTKYYYTIRAVNAAGREGNWLQEYASATVSVLTLTPTPLSTQPTTTPTPTPTDAPVNFRVSDVGRDWVSLQWETAPGNLGITSAEIAKYEHNGSGYHYVDRRSVGISGRSIVLYYLKSDTLYKFSLRFLDVDNDVVRSQTVTARTQAPQTTQTPTATPQASQTTQTPTPTPTDDPPMNFRISGVGRDWVSLQWERAPRNRGIVSGKIEAHEHMGSAYQFVASYDAGLLAGNLRASHLRPDTLYKFILLFSNQAGDVVRRQTVTERTQTTQTTATPTPTPTTSKTLCANTGAIPDPEAAGLVADCETLLGLKDELAGSAALNWSVDRLIEDWDGVTVAGERVTELDLSSNVLTGRIPSSLGSLTALQNLVLEKNQLTGRIPSSLGSLTALQNLLLHDNQLTGRIPSSLDRLVPPSGSLSAVWLATGNALCGPIPPQLHAFIPSNPSSNNDVSSVHYPSGTLGGCSSSSPSPTPTATPTATPTLTAAPVSTLPVPQLTAQAGANAVELRWTEVSGAARYELMTWWDAGTGWQPIGGANLTGTSYTHTGVTAGTTYYYTIRAVNAAGETSGWLGAETDAYPSVTVSQGVPAGGTSTATPTPTATAAGLSIPALTAAATDDGVALRWGAVQGAVRYDLMAWWDAETGWQPIGGANLTGTSYTHTGVTAGTTYYYTIRAVNAAGGTSAWLLQYATAVPSR